MFPRSEGGSPERYVSGRAALERQDAPADRANASATRPGGQWTRKAPQRGSQAVQERCRTWNKRPDRRCAPGSPGERATLAQTARDSRLVRLPRRRVVVRGGRGAAKHAISDRSLDSRARHQSCTRCPASPEISHISSDLLLAPPALAQSSARVCLSGAPGKAQLETRRSARRLRRSVLPAAQPRRRSASHLCFGCA